MIRDFPTAGLAERGRAWLDAGSPEGVPPRLAATVQLLRDGADGPEVFVIERVASMAFAPSMVVFPGGGVDARDAEPLDAVGLGDPQALGLGAQDAEVERSVLVAAVRELFEECGVLLASARGDDALVDPAPLAADRARLAAGETSLAQVVGARGLVVRADLLRPVARWVTPHFEGRRYDTLFVAARCPDGQEPDGATTEAASSRWLRPVDALAAFERGELRLLPPTLAALEELARFHDVDAALAAGRPVDVVTPELVDLAAEGGEGLVIRVRTGDDA